MHVKHYGKRFEPIAKILDARLPLRAIWRVDWEGEHCTVATDEGSFIINCGRAFGPYSATKNGPIATVVQDAFDEVKRPLIDRLLTKRGAS